MAVKTITTPWEAIKEAPVSNKYPPSYVAKHIRKVERKFAREFLGSDFYQLLLDDVQTDFGNIEEWNVDATYSTGDYAIYFDCVLESLQDDNTTVPCEDDGTNWKEADKFSSDCYNEIWIDYLLPYFAHLCIYESLDYSTYQIGAKGVTEFFEDASGIRSAGRDKFLNQKNKLMQDAEEYLTDFKDFLKDNTDSQTCDYSKILWLQSCSTNTIKGKSRQIAWKK